MSADTLPALVDRAAQTLAGARSAAEVLDAQDKAAAAYTAAKAAGRLAKAREAYDELIPAIHRAQADALVIEAGAKRRLADEYEVAQRLGEVAAHGGGKSNLGKPKVKDAGLTYEQMHEARKVRDAEAASPGIVRATVEAALASGAEPTKALVRKAVEKAVPRRGEPQPENKNAERIERQRIKARLWGELRSALEGLAGMPAASDIAAIAAGTAHAAPIVDRHLASALTFLKEFSDAWNHRA